MEIHKDRLYQMTVLANNKEIEKREFNLNKEQLMFVLTSIGKPVSICLTDTVGECWWIPMTNITAELDMEDQTLKLKPISNYHI